VALGTVADVVPLDKNNRILVKKGLERIRNGLARPGIAALIAVAGRNTATLVASDLGFAVGPRLNAAGRLEDMSLGIACLLAEDPNQAHELAVELDNLNKQRRTIEANMQQKALTLLRDFECAAEPGYGVCLYDASWHQGVVGILASRIKDRLHRPVIAFADAGDGLLKGSARSISGVHIRDVLATLQARQPDLLVKFGGHAMAAGLTLAKEQLVPFRQAFNSELKTLLTPADLTGQVLSDGSLTEAELRFEVAEQLRYAGPWGQQFPEPQFDNVFTVLEQRLVGEKHLKLTLGLDGYTRAYTAIAFNVDLTQWPNPRCDTIHAVYRLDINEFRGLRSLQLVINHLEALS